MGHEMELGTVVNPDDVVVYDGIIRIYDDDKIKTIYLTAEGDETDVGISLSDCKKIAKDLGIGWYGHFCVLIEDFTEGSLYSYGDYLDDSWYLRGKTMGFA